MKKLAVILLLSAAPAIAMAQQVKTVTQAPLDEAVNAFALQEPDEGSPFFQDRLAAQTALSQESKPQQAASSEMATYPKSKDASESMLGTFTKFFTDMFGSIKFNKIGEKKSDEKLGISPEKFSLVDRRELDTTYAVYNNTKRIMRIDFPSSQHIDILTMDPQGKVIDKWSDDRTFDQKEGIVFINPHERIQYDEKIPTREMKAGETYNVQAELMGNPEYTTSKTVTPSE